MSGHCTVAAVDLGASSGRVLVGRFGADVASLQEVHRFPNEPVRVAGVLHWDILRLFHGVLEGLRRSEEVAGPLDSVGIDSWGVDYGLLDPQGRLLSNPVHYRDGRTAAVAQRTVTHVGGDVLYAATGTQFQPFNTVFQLLAEHSGTLLTIADAALLVPDLVGYWLSGVRGTELTNASTTGLLDARTGTWSTGLADRLDLDVSLFPPLHRPGTVLGPVLADMRQQAQLRGTPQVVAVPSHDTAAAVAGVPAAAGTFAYVCTGTWALVGVELPAPVISEAGRAANFTNELGADGTTRYLRNVTGFWLLQECARAWALDGAPVDLDALTIDAAALPGLHWVVDVQDPAFVPPGDMPARIAAAARGATRPQTRPEILRCILDSMALAIRAAVRDAAGLSGQPVEVVHVVGGGVGNALFCQLVADACALPVLAGPAEAASWGNAVAQAQALGVVQPGLAAAREVVRAAVAPVRYGPRGDAAQWDAAAGSLR